MSKQVTQEPVKPVKKIVTDAAEAYKIFNAFWKNGRAGSTKWTLDMNSSKGTAYYVLADIVKWYGEATGHYLEPGWFARSLLDFARNNPGKIIVEASYGMRDTGLPAGTVMYRKG